MLIVTLAGDHLYGKWLFTWLTLVLSLMASFVLSFFPRDVLDEIWDLLQLLRAYLPTLSDWQRNVHLSTMHMVCVL